MQFNSSAIELTTAATDAILAIASAFLAAWLCCFPDHRSWKARLWAAVLGLLAVASTLGAIAHGLDLSPAWQNFLWQPLYLALGIDVALFVLGGMYDWCGERVARRLLPGAVLTGVAFYCLTLTMDGAFVVFVAYEGAAMAVALAIYVALAARKKSPGAGIMALAIALNIAAAALQASTVSLTAIWTFDHNGIFHLVQMAALATLAGGLSIGLSRSHEVNVRTS